MLKAKMALGLLLMAAAWALVFVAVVDEGIMRSQAALLPILMILSALVGGLMINKEISDE